MQKISLMPYQKKKKLLQFVFRDGLPQKNVQASIFSCIQARFSVYYKDVLSKKHPGNNLKFYEFS